MCARADLRPLATVGLDADATAQRHKRQLVLARRERPDALRRQATNLEMDVFPTGQLRRDFYNNVRVGGVAGVDNQGARVILSHTDLALPCGVGAMQCGNAPIRLLCTRVHWDGGSIQEGV